MSHRVDPTDFLGLSGIGTTPTIPRRDESRAPEQTVDDPDWGASVIPRPSQRFETTHWSWIEKARAHPSGAASRALSYLCEVYWTPVYGHARSRGLNEVEAQDATQEFFAKILANNFLQNVSRSHGRFRSYILASFDHLLADRWEKSRAQKRGGSTTIHLGPEAAHNERDGQRSPDQEFDYQWLLALVRRVMLTLEAEYRSTGRSDVYVALRPLLLGESATRAEAIGKSLGLTTANTRTVLHRLRRRYKELFRTEVARTVTHPLETDDEIRCLLRILDAP